MASPRKRKLRKLARLEKAAELAGKAVEEVKAAVVETVVAAVEEVKEAVSGIKDTVVEMVAGEEEATKPKKTSFREKLKLQSEEEKKEE